MSWRIALRAVGWLLVVWSVVNLATLAIFPGVRETLISVPSVITRFSFALVAGLGFVLLRKWGLVVYGVGALIKLYQIFSIYGGLRTIPVWVSVVVSALVIAVAVLNWRQLRW